MPAIGPLRRVHFEDACAYYQYLTNLKIDWLEKDKTLYAWKNQAQYNKCLNRCVREMRRLRREEDARLKYEIRAAALKHDPEQVARMDAIAERRKAARARILAGKRRWLLQCKQLVD